ncbi:MAG: HupE/UreJ family protein [Pseudaminobacter sp.]|nr:HupE/UreJ family protein [Pseudaminobacter sp.]
MSKSMSRGLLCAALITLPSVAMAHTGQSNSYGFLHGFLHPIGGLDHILAMVLVGLVAVQLGGKAIWLVPASFLAMMAVGGAAGLTSFPVPFVEVGIAMSVIVLGAVVGLNLAAPTATIMGLVGFFAIFHGYAHGAEMPESAAGLAYGVGFVIATAILHLLGVASGFAVAAASRTHGGALVRVMGASASVAGVGILAGAL